MIISFSIIGFLVLVLIYFVVRNQSLQREINQYKHSLKSSDSHAKLATHTLSSVSGELQKTFLSRLEANHKRGIISGDDYKVLGFILNHVDFVIMQCLEQKRTVEESVNKALESSELEITDVNQFIAKQPSEIRVPWCKNSVNSFVTACNNLSVGQLKTAAPKAEATPA